jgi:DNA polymerase V
MLDDLCAIEDTPSSLFDAPSPLDVARMAAMGTLNARFGRGTMFIAAIGTKRAWKLRAEHHSPRYTTRMAELRIARA